MNRPCEVCGGQAFRPFPNRRQVPLSRCNSCALIRCTTIPSNEDLAEIYTKDYYRSWGIDEFHDSVEKMKRQTFGSILSRVEQLLPGRGNLLDVGCAVGFLLLEAQAHGWTPYGIELAESAVEEAKTAFGPRVERLRLEDNPFPGVEFQAITMIDLLEHVREPGELLALCRRRLSPGGVVVIGTPNTDSISAKLSGGSWEQIKLEHLYYFSPDNLGRLLQKSGFDVVTRMTLRKSLNWQYITSQLTVYPLPVVTSLVRLTNALLPRAARSKNFWTSAGEMLVIAKKA